MDGEHSAAESARIGIALDREAAGFGIGILADDRPLAGQLPLAAEPFALDQPIFRTIVARQLARQVLFAPPSLMRLAKLGADFLLAGHSLIVVLSGP